MTERDCDSCAPDSDSVNFKSRGIRDEVEQTFEVAPIRDLVFQPLLQDTRTVVNFTYYDKFFVSRSLTVVKSLQGASWWYHGKNGYHYESNNGEEVLLHGDTLHGSLHLMSGCRCMVGGPVRLGRLGPPVRVGREITVV